MKKISKEMVWCLMMITGLFRQLGGSPYVKKAIHRFGIPIIMFLAGWYWLGFSWQLIAMAITQFGAFTLPFTLIGDGIPEHKFNWVWIWIWAVLRCISPLWLGFAALPAVPIVAFIVGLAATLSNVPATAKWFQWKLVEGLSGMSPLVIFAYHVTLS